MTFFRLGKIKGGDALGYVAAQFVGGTIGLWLAAQILGLAIEHPAVNYVVTVPGLDGAAVAFAAETMISFGLMLVVLIVSNRPSLSRWTGVFAVSLAATYIAAEAPLSGMSMNPARSFASALPHSSGPTIGSISSLRSVECSWRLNVMCAPTASTGSSAPSCTITTTLAVSSIAAT